MSEAYLTNWTFEGETPGTRSHFHDTALREARAATDHRNESPALRARDSFVTRLRFAFGGQPAADACNCPA